MHICICKVFKSLYIAYCILYIYKKILALLENHFSMHLWTNQGQKIIFNLNLIISLNFSYFCFVLKIFSKIVYALACKSESDESLCTQTQDLLPSIAAHRKYAICKLCIFGYFVYAYLHIAKTLHMHIVYAYLHIKKFV